ncbi:hypothetical protein Tco_1503493 [Tanacetum coccineum]
MKRAAKITSTGSKKKAKAKADTGKGLKVLSKVAIFEEAQLKEVLRRSKQDFHISHASGSGDGDSNKDDDYEKAALDKVGNDDDDDDGDDDKDNNDDETEDDKDQEDEEENADDINFSDTKDDEEKNEEEEENYEMFKLLNLENVSPAEYTLDSVMDTNAQPTSSTMITTTPLPPHLVIPLIQQTTPTPAPTTHVPTILDSITFVLVLPDFASMFNFNQRVSLGYAIQSAFYSYKVEFEKEAQAEQERFIEIIDKSVKEMVKDEVKSQLIRILPKKIADFATPLIERTIADSYERVVLAKSFSQPKSTYEATASLNEFELKKILLDKMKDNEKDKDEDPSARPDRGEKRRKTDKDAAPSKDPNLKGFKSSSSSKGISRSPHKSTGKSIHSEEPRYDSGMPHDQEFDRGTNDDQPVVEAAKDDWFMKPDKPPTPDHEWNKRQSINLKLP